MSNIKVVSSTQRIVVNPATSSVSVINAGPIGPRGFVGPSEAATILTTNGDLLTRVAGVLAPITRANLAADPAFTSRFPSVVNHGSTAGTARTGTAPIFWIGSVDPTNATNNDELFRTDTVVLSKRIAGAWVIVGGSVFVGTNPPSTPTDGKLWWDTDDTSLLVDTIAPSVLAVDAAFTSRYASITRHGGTWRRNATQSINNGTYTAIAWDNELTDTDSYAVPTWTVWTCPAGLGGPYTFTVQVTYAVTGLNANSIRIVVSSVTDPFELAGIQTIGGIQSGSITIPIVAGDTVTFQTMHTNGVAQNVSRARLDIFKWPVA